MGYQVKTADYDEAAQPDYLIDVRKLSSVVHETFDVILCCEILEHIPFEDVSAVLMDCASISNQYLIITLIYIHWTQTAFLSNSSHFKPLKWIKILIFPKILSIVGGHYWNRQTYSLTKIVSLIESVNGESSPLSALKIHTYLFVCEKRALQNTYEK